MYPLNAQQSKTLHSALAAALLHALHRQSHISDFELLALLQRCCKK